MSEQVLEQRAPSGSKTMPADAGNVRPTPKHVRERQLARSAALGQVVEILHRPQLDEYFLRGLAKSLNEASTIPPTLADEQAAAPIEDEADETDDDPAEPEPFCVPIELGMRVNGFENCDGTDGVVIDLGKHGCLIRKDNGDVFGSLYKDVSIHAEAPADDDTAEPTS